MRRAECAQHGVERQVHHRERDDRVVLLHRQRHDQALPLVLLEAHLHRRRRRVRLRLHQHLRLGVAELREIAGEDLVETRRIEIDVLEIGQRGMQRVGCRLASLCTALGERVLHDRRRQRRLHALELLLELLADRGDRGRAHRVGFRRAGFLGMDEPRLPGEEHADREQQRAERERHQHAHDALQRCDQRRHARLPVDARLARFLLVVVLRPHQPFAFNADRNCRSRLRRAHWARSPGPRRTSRARSARTRAGRCARPARW